MAGTGGGAMKGDLSDLVARSIMLDRLEADYQYRRSTRWGRFLLWLLRKTT